MRFHPFQGRPLFGHKIVKHSATRRPCSFHPFQGRPLFGQIILKLFYLAFGPKVSIPFREDLYSDMFGLDWIMKWRLSRFHPFQGRPLFGQLSKTEAVVAYPVRVSIPFREDLYSDGTRGLNRLSFFSRGFHPFQGRPLFGRRLYLIQNPQKASFWFPSLSGKTSIRTSASPR